MANIKLKLVDENYQISKTGSLGLFINGRCEATYYRNDIPKDATIIENMLSTAFEEGKRERSVEIKKLIG